MFNKKTSPQQSILLCAGWLILTPACTSLREATDTLDPQGPTSLSQQDYVLTKVEPYSPGAVGIFEASYSVALQYQTSISKGNAGPRASTDPALVHGRQMAVNGMFLVNTYCAKFFRASGSSQKWLNVATGATALATATACNGVDLYARNFLFGSDNIESVRVLTMNAQAAHTAKLLSTIDMTIWTFGNAAEAIDDHQDLCSPASIRSLVLAAIRRGSVTAYQPAGLAPSLPATAGDNALLAASAAGATAAAKVPALTPLPSNAPAAPASVSSALSQISTAQSGLTDTPTVVEALIRQKAVGMQPMRL